MDVLTIDTIDVMDMEISYSVKYTFIPIIIHTALLSTVFRQTTAVYKLQTIRFRIGFDLYDIDRECDVNRRQCPNSTTVSSWIIYDNIIWKVGNSCWPFLIYRLVQKPETYLRNFQKTNTILLVRFISAHQTLKLLCNDLDILYTSAVISDSDDNYHWYYCIVEYSARLSSDKGEFPLEIYMPTFDFFFFIRVYNCIILCRSPDAYESVRLHDTKKVSRSIESTIGTVYMCKYNIPTALLAA